MGYEQNEHRVLKLISNLEEVVKNFLKEGAQENRDAQDEVTNLITASGFVFAKQISIIIKDNPAYIEQLDGYISNCRDVALKLYDNDKEIANETQSDKTQSNKTEFNNENLH